MIAMKTAMKVATRTEWSGSDSPSHPSADSAEGNQTHRSMPAGFFNGARLHNKQSQRQIISVAIDLHMAAMVADALA